MALASKKTFLFLCAFLITLSFIQRAAAQINSASLDQIFSQSQIVLFGEDHFTALHERHEILSLFSESQQVAPAQNLCIFYELSSDKTIADHLDNFKEKMRISKSDYSNSIRQFQVLHDSAQFFKIREFTVDEASLLLSLEDPRLHDRNLAMAKKIIKNFQSLSCQKALFFIGRDHLEKSYLVPSPLQQVLRASGFAVTTVNYSTPKHRLCQKKTGLFRTKQKDYNFLFCTKKD